MSEHEREKLTPIEARSQRAVRELPEPAASARYRERLKSAFIDGTIREAAPPPPEIVRTPWYARPFAATLGIAAAAAVVIFAVFTMNRGPAWELRGPVPSTLSVDGAPTQMTDEAVAEMLKPDVFIACEDSAGVTFAMSKTLTVQLTPGSEVMLPRAPGRWFARTIRAEVPRGEVRFTTGRDFHDAKLLVQTPEAFVEILGTTVAVIREDFGTCVCVLEGTVRLASRVGGAMTELEGGRRRTLFNDGRESFEEDIFPMERMKLEMLRDSFRQPPP